MGKVKEEAAQEALRALSPSQVKALLWCNSDGSPREWEKGAPARVSFYALADVVIGKPDREIARFFKLARKGKGEKRPGRIWPEDTWELTPLGIAAHAAALREKEAG